MIFKFLLAPIKNLEEPKYPLLGPNLKGLRIFGLLQHDNKYIRHYFKCVHFFSLLFVISQYVELYFNRKDFKNALINMSVSALSVVAIFKSISCLVLQSRLRNLIKAISKEEIITINRRSDYEVKQMKHYRNYTRITTTLYWSVILTTCVVTILTPFLKFATSPLYREEINIGVQSYPQILSSWFPFDKTTLPGYLFANITHIFMTVQGFGVIAVYDTHAVAIMTFFKGQFVILREKCRRIVGNDEETLTNAEVLVRIKECHRHHNFLLTQYSIFNSIVSPVMFLYVLVCSMGICCSVVQLSLDELPASQKLWVLEYALTLFMQLFLFCWHSNEIWIQSNEVDRGVYESKWWKANLYERKHLVLLAAKLSLPIIINAGPFTDLSVRTFVDIIKATYSFYTLFTQIQEKQ